MKSLRKRSAWMLLTLFLLPVLAFSFWYGRQVRQHHLDHALIKAIKRNDTKTAIALLDQGADANVVDKPYKTVTLTDLWADFWNRVKGNRPKADARSFTPALLVPYSRRTGRMYVGILASNKAGKMFSLPPEYDLKPEPMDNPELVSALLNHGANPDSTDEDGRGILMHSAMRSHLKTLQVLLKHPIHPNVQDTYGFTPLMYADLATARLLVERGAKVSLINSKGCTAMDYVGMMNRQTDAEDKAHIRLLKEALINEKAEQNSSIKSATK